MYLYIHVLYILYMNLSVSTSFSLLLLHQYHLPPPPPPPSPPPPLPSSSPEVVLSFLSHQYPLHLALTASTAMSVQQTLHLESVLLRVARAVHSLLLLAPLEVLDQLEEEELLYDPPEGEVEYEG